MNLTLPDPLVTPGPLFASEINTAFDTVDSHNHTSGEGASVPTAGLNINANLTFNGFAAYSLAYTTYASYSVSPTLTTSVYVINGELAYKDGNGTEVVITNNGSIAGASGTITGLVSPASASFSSITGTFVFSNDVAQAGKIAGSDYIMYKFGDTSGNNLTHKWAPASPTSYTIQYPDDAPLTNDSVAKTTTAGVQTFNAFGLVPVGGIIAIASNLTGSFAIPSTGTSSRGWQLCDGAAVEAGGVLSGSVPTLNDGRFLRGFTSSGVTGGANSFGIDHRHIIAHVHQMVHADSSAVAFHALSAQDSSSVSISNSDTNFITSNNVYTATGASYASIVNTGSNNNYYTTGALSAPFGGGAGATSGFMDGNSTVATIPVYLNCQYLVRIK